MAILRTCVKSGRWRSAVLVALLLCPEGVRPAAASFSGGVGYDYQSGPNGETWRAPLGFATVATGSSDATLALLRYDSSNVGWGWSGFANVGLGITSRAIARAIGIRSVGDGDYRAWRVQAGPTFQLTEDRLLSVYVAHFEDNLAARLDQIGAETSFPIGIGLSGLAGAAIGDRQGGQSNVQGSAGLTWTPRPVLQVFGQTTIGRNAVSSTAGVVGPSGGGHGRMSTSTTTSGASFDAVALVGLRVMVP